MPRGTRNLPFVTSLERGFLHRVEPQLVEPELTPDDRTRRLDDERRQPLAAIARRRDDPPLRSLERIEHDRRLVRAGSSTRRRQPMPQRVDDPLDVARRRRRGRLRLTLRWQRAVRSVVDERNGRRRRRVRDFERDRVITNRLLNPVCGFRGGWCFYFLRGG